jgi:hypothetical protein
VPRLVNVSDPGLLRRASFLAVLRKVDSDPLLRGVSLLCVDLPNIGKRAGQGPHDRSEAPFRPNSIYIILLVIVRLAWKFGLIAIEASWCSGQCIYKELEIAAHRFRSLCPTTPRNRGRA